MNDLISRRGAIALIRSRYSSAPFVRINYERWKEKYKLYIEIEKALERLPSLQSEIILCKDCKHYGSLMGACHNPRFGDGWANYSPPYVNEDFFCKDGEKMDEVTDD